MAMQCPQMREYTVCIRTQFDVIARFGGSLPILALRHR